MIENKIVLDRYFLVFYIDFFANSEDPNIVKEKILNQECPCIFCKTLFIHKVTTQILFLALYWKFDKTFYCKTCGAFITFYFLFKL